MKKTLKPGSDRLGIGGFVDGAVDREGGFFFEVFVRAGVEPVQFLDYATEVPQTSTVNFAHPAGVPSVEAAPAFSSRHRYARSASRAARTMGGGIDNSVTRP
jgi:hypothetical protein